MSHPAVNYTRDLFDDDPPPAVVVQVPGGYRALAIAELARNPQDYDRVFVSWLKENWKVWTSFCRLADNLRNNGRKNYSARALFHVLRYDSEMRERPVVASVVPQFKVNNRWSAGMARLFNAMTPDRAGFFFTRESSHGDPANDS